MSDLPVGYRFRPTDVELVVNYLTSKIRGQPLPCERIPVMDLYSGDPWMVLENNVQNQWDETDWDVKGNVTKITTYIFTQLTPIKKKDFRKKKQGHGNHNKDRSRENYLRTAGCGTWKLQNCKNVFNKQGQLVGFKRYLAFETSKKKSNTKNPSTTPPSGHHYTMHEFSLVRGESTFVLCEISLYFKTGDTSTTSFYDHQVSCVHDDEITRVWKRPRSVDVHPLVSQVTSIPPIPVVEEGGHVGTSFSSDWGEEISRVPKTARSLDDNQFGSAGADYQQAPQVTNMHAAETSSSTIFQEKSVADDNNERDMMIQEVCFNGALNTNLSVAESNSETKSIEGCQTGGGNTQAQQPLITEQGYHDVGTVYTSMVAITPSGGCDQESLNPCWVDYNSMELAVFDQCNPDELVMMIKEIPCNIVQGEANDQEQLMAMMDSSNRVCSNNTNVQHQSHEGIDHVEGAPPYIHSAATTSTAEDHDGLMPILDKMSNDNIQPTEDEYINGLLQIWDEHEKLFGSSGNVADGLHLLDFGNDDEPYWSCLKLKNMS